MKKGNSIKTKENKPRAFFFGNVRLLFFQCGMVATWADGARRPTSPDAGGVVLVAGSRGTSSGALTSIPELVRNS